MSESNKSRSLYAERFTSAVNRNGNHDWFKTEGDSIDPVRIGLRTIRDMIKFGKSSDDPKPLFDSAIYPDVEPVIAQFLECLDLSERQPAQPGEVSTLGRIAAGAVCVTLRELRTDHDCRRVLFATVDSAQVPISQ